MAPGSDTGTGLAMGHDQLVQKNQSKPQSKQEEVSLDYRSAPVELIAKTGIVPDCFLRSYPVDIETELKAELPVIDLEKYLSGDDQSKAETRAKVAHACEEWGFFQVVNHGASSPLLEEGLDVVRRFYALPVEAKLKCAMKPGSRNWSGYGRLSQIATAETGFDWQDGFWHHDPVWHGPAEGHEWPDEPADYRDKMAGWQLEIRKVASVLHEIFSKNLGLPTTTYMEEIFTLSPVRTNYYPPCPRATEVLGFNTHTDASSMNILQQLGDVAGLQVLHRGNWITIRPAPGALVVNIGDILEIMSNGKYKSLLHRAAVNSKVPRISVVMGFRPSPERLLTPFSQTIDEDHPLLYRSLTYNDYLQLRAGKPPDEAKEYVNSKILLSMATPEAFKGK